LFLILFLDILFIKYYIYRKINKIMKHQFQPESLMMSLGYSPEWSEGAIKCPIFQTSTFVFKNAQEGKAFFEVAYGLREKEQDENVGLIYSRINNPDLEILEQRIAVWENAEDCASFESGMSAITTVMLEFLKPGDLLLCSKPLYGGTDHFVNYFLNSIGVHVIGFDCFETQNEIMERINSSGLGGNLAMIYVETPANPTNTITDIGMCKQIAEHYKQQNKKDVIIAVDNTYMGPLWQHPLELGADVSIYSATKYLAGHSDLIAGACCGSKSVISRIRVLRTFLGNMIAPYTAWLLMRSLETLKIRMEKQAENAEKVAAYLKNHPKVEKIYYLGNLKPEDGRQFELYQKQHSSAGAMISFDIKGNEKDAFRFIDSLKLIKLAVSLGSTESLVEHPYTMTHAGVDTEHKIKMNITEKMIRLSVGVENASDLIWDIEQAFEN
jgi:methionine-gamma-lyase